MDGERLPPGLAPIRRARGFRLYDVKGRRYLDLFREGALLGHRAEGVLTVMKSVLAQGLVGPLPSIWERRLLAALARRFPGYAEIRLYASAERAMEAARRYLGIDGPLEVHDPALRPAAARVLPAAAWRPFLPVPGARVLLPVLPVRVDGAPSPACFETSAPRDLPLPDPIAGFVLAGALRGLLAVEAAERAGGGLSNPAVERAIDASAGWDRAGPYVRARFPSTEYRRIHREFVEAGVLLCPGWPGPSVLPGDCSPGETRLLAGLFSAHPGG